ncbi:MAG: AAA family ATPase [Eubacterium sp.]|nr:AAA family ATPase [Eubacterium sp.]
MGKKETITPTTTIKGKITSVNCAKSNWCAFRVRTEQDVVIGMNGNDLPAIRKGEEYSFTGTLYEDPKWGTQMKVLSISPWIKETKRGIINYLSSSNFPGIGPKIAESIVSHFGTKNTLRILKTKPERLDEIQGLSKAKKQIIIDGIRTDELALELQTITNGGLTMNQISKIAKAYGKDACKRIKKNPYDLCYDVDGIGFLKADAIAKNMGIDDFSPFRVEEGIVYALKEQSETQGNVYSNLNDLLEDSIDALFPVALSFKKRQVTKKVYESFEKRQAAYDKAGFNTYDYQILQQFRQNRPKYEQAISEALKKDIENQKVVYEIDQTTGEKRVYWKRLYDAEKETAYYLNRLIQSDPVREFSDGEIQAGILAFEKEQTEKGHAEGWLMPNQTFTMEEEQKSAVKTALQNRISVITGGAGCGKTTILSCICKIWETQAKKKDSIVLSAPTGKAAQRMKETTGRDATTIHMRLAREETHQNELCVIDESSMIDIVLAEKTLRLFKDKCQLLFIGDFNQLPSVGPGAFFQDLCKSPHISTARLTKGHRNQGNIALNANRINKGEPFSTFTFGDDYVFVECENENVIPYMKSCYQKFLENGVTEEQMIIISPQVKQGRSCVNNCNDAIRELKREMYGEPKKIPKTQFFVNDRVMCIRNNHYKEGENTEANNIKGIYNGDTGTLDRYDEGREQARFLCDDGREYWLTANELDDFAPAYAISCHKSQGSEYPVVMMSITMEFYMMLKRNILYTGTTRASKRLLLFGSSKALNAAIRNQEYNQRNTLLQERIKSNNPFL